MITLELAKLHQRIDGNEEDDLCRLYLEAAIDDCVAYLNCPLYENEAAATGKPDGVILNSAIRSAILLTFGYFYSVREDGRSGMPLDARRLLFPYRKLVGV